MNETTEQKPEKFQLAKFASRAEQRKSLRKGKLAFKINGKVVAIGLTNGPTPIDHRSLVAVLHDSAGNYLILRRDQYDTLTVHLPMQKKGDREKQIGTFNLRFIDRWLDPEFRRRGIATHALKCIEKLHAAYYGGGPNVFGTVKRSTALFLAKRAHYVEEESGLTLAQIRRSGEELPRMVYFKPKPTKPAFTKQDLEQNHVLVVAGHSGKREWYVLPRREK
ncbi:MAG: hypothetical protein V1722_02780 [Candidatus Micrarchaeota archaeon]